MLDNLKTWAIIGLLIGGCLSTFGAYTRGKQVGENELRSYYEAAERANNDFWQAKLDKISESETAARLQLNQTKLELQNETTKNSQLIRDNNRITKQFRMLVDASAKADVRLAAGNQLYAQESEGIGADRILSTIQSNYAKCNEWREQVILWQQWYGSQ